MDTAELGGSDNRVWYAIEDGRSAKFAASYREVAIKKLSIADLDPLALFPTCLDDQWLDREGIYHLGEFQPKNANAKAITEFKRCLLSGTQLVINRAHLINNGALWEIWNNEDYGRTLDGLLADGTIIPYLHLDSEAGFEHAEIKVGFGAQRLSDWRAKADRINISCIRFDWHDDERNKRQCDQLLARRFSNRLGKLLEPGSEFILPNLMPGKGRRHDEMIAAFRGFLDDEFKRGLDQCRDDTGMLWRGALYRQFRLGREQIASNEQPFRKELKQIIDLIYNSNLSDSLEISAIAPSDTSTRADLSEDGSAKSRTLAITPHELAELFIEGGDRLRRWSDPNLPVFVPEALSIGEIATIRRESRAWRAYTKACSNLSMPVPEDGNASLVDCLIGRLEAVNETSNEFRQELLLAYSRSRYWKTSGVAKTYDLVARIGAGRIGAAAVTGLEYAAGVGSVGLGLAGLVGAEIAAEKVNQAVDWAVDQARLGFATSRFPRFEMDASEEAAAELLGLLRDAGAKPANEISVSSAQSELNMDEVTGYG